MSSSRGDRDRRRREFKTREMLKEMGLGHLYFSYREYADILHFSIKPSFHDLNKVKLKQLFSSNTAAHNVDTGQTYDNFEEYRKDLLILKMIGIGDLQTILAKVMTNTNKNSKNYYAPLSEQESALVRSHYEKELEIPVEGNDTIEIETQSGVSIAKGYNRVVIGDYGAYVEFRPEQLNLSIIRPRWEGKPRRPVKYIWMEIEGSKAKVYHQQKKVKYADYIPGMYYIDPNELIFSK